jgi:hypothetical protein
MMTTRALAIAVVVAASIGLSARQTRDVPRVLATGTAQIAGTVMTGDQTPAPIRRATVVLTGELLADKVIAVTDDSGAFAFMSLPADRYSLSVSKAGYVPMNYGSKRSGGSGTPIVVIADQRATVAMRLVRGGVISGTVRDGLGRPLPDVTVTAFRYVMSFETGERTLQNLTVGSAGQMVSNFAPDAFPGTAMTDDRGDYRIYGLAPGEYIVSASVRSPMASSLSSTDVHQVTAADVQRAQQLLRGSNLGPTGEAPSGNQRIQGSSRVDYVPVYHPGATAREEAATITLGPSEERQGVDVLIRLVRTASVSGVITSPNGAPIYNAQVSVMDPVASNTRVLRTTRSNEDGEFVIPGVPPGRYQVQASSYPDGLSGMTEVAIEGQDISAPFILSPGVTVSGRIVFDGKTPAPPFSAVPPILRRQVWALGAQRFEMSPDGRFVYSSVTPGRYTLTISGRPPAGWVLRSSMVNGSDVSDIALDIKPGQNVEGAVITLTDRPAEISGVLQTAAGEPAPEYVLIVFSSDKRFWVPRSRRTRQVRPDVSGRFVARDLPAGDYLIAAVTDVEDGQWNDPAFLAALAASSPIPIALVEGDKKIQNIRIGGR